MISRTMNNKNKTIWMALMYKIDNINIKVIYNFYAHNIFASPGRRAMEEWRPQRFFPDAGDQLCKETEHEANWQQRSILLNFDHLIGK